MLLAYCSSPQYFTAFKSAEGEGFEPSVPCDTHAFQACALDHYANPPYRHSICERPDKRKTAGRGARPSVDAPQSAASSCSLSLNKASARWRGFVRVSPGVFPRRAETCALKSTKTWRRSIPDWSPNLKCLALTTFPPLRMEFQECRFIDPPVLPDLTIYVKRVFH